MPESEVVADSLRIFQAGIELDSADVTVSTVDGKTQIKVADSALRPSTAEKETQLVALYSTGDQNKLKYDVLFPGQLRDVKNSETSEIVPHTLVGNQIVFTCLLYTSPSPRDRG